MKGILIEKCFQCSHFTHSGAFTQGGAIPLCGKIGGHGIRIRGVALNGGSWPDAYNSVLPFTNEENRYGKVIRRATGNIPNWCPLPDVEKKQL